MGSFYEQDHITGQTQLKCCGPTAQKISKQMPNQDILDYGSRAGVSEKCIYTYEHFCHIKGHHCGQGIAHPLMIRTPD